MSAHSRSVSLTQEAQRDYDDILLYGLRTWGAEQTRRYQIRLDEAIAELVDFPEIGPRRDDLFTGCRRRLVEHHIIYYCIENDAIVVVNILHERADPARHLLR